MDIKYYYLYICIYLHSIIYIEYIKIIKNKIVINFSYYDGLNPNVIVPPLVCIR